MNKDALYKEYFDLQKERNGISPKVSLWAKLNSRMEEIKTILGVKEITKNGYLGISRKEASIQRKTYFQNKMWSKTGFEFTTPHLRSGNASNAGDILMRPGEAGAIIRAKSKRHSRQYVLSKGWKIGDGRTY